MTAIAAYPVKSPYHSLAIARINEHVSTSFHFLFYFEQLQEKT